MGFDDLAVNLRNYDKNKRSLTEAEKELDAILYELCGVKGISYDTIIVHGNPSQKALNWLKKDDRYNEVEKEISYYRSAIEMVDLARQKIPGRIWEMLIDIFVKGETYKAVGSRHGYSANGFWYHLRKETERYL